MLAEDALQDALVSALERWEIDGVPRNPGAWLLTVAKRRAIDRLRRLAKFEPNPAILDSLAAPEEEPEMDDSIPDDRLKLMFTCCHPALALMLLRLETQANGYYPFHAARADLLRRMDQREAAADAYKRALDLSSNRAERAYLQWRLDKMLDL